VNGLDIALGLAVFAAFVGGYRRGLLLRVSTWVFAVLGLLLVASNLDWVLQRLGSPKAGQRVGTLLLALVAGAIIGRLVGYLFGSWIQDRLPSRPLRTLNRFGGGLVGVAGVAFVAWLALPLLALIPGWPATTTRGSFAAKTLSGKMPGPPNALSSLRRLVDGGRIPQVIDILEGSVDAGSAPLQSTIPTGILTGFQPFSVKLSSTACGVVTDGSALAIGGSRVLTSAHGVSGATKVTGTIDSGEQRKATVVAIDPKRDLAIVSLEGWSSEAAPFTDADPGMEVATFGYPGGGGLAITPGGVQQIATSKGRDIYDKASAVRTVAVLASKLASGDAGGAVLNNLGEVVGMAFAVAPDRPSTSYAVPTVIIREFLADVDAGSRGTLPGACLQSR
jgi:S1-C subfamily serine protease